MIQKLFKILTVTLYLFFLLGGISLRAEASNLFFDDFNDPNDNQWLDLSGLNIWYEQNGMYGGITGSGVFDAILKNFTPPSDYAIEFDYLGLQGLDKNIDFRWSNNFTGYELHFNSNGGQNFLSKAGLQPPGWPVATNFYPQNGQTYHFKIVLNGSHIIIYADNSILIDTLDQYYSPINNEQIGLRIGAGSVSPTEVYFDNFVVRDIQPGDIPGDLNVPVIKQTDSPWGQDIYDSANFWSPLTPTISSWGCALTSAAMVLNYYGYHIMPDGNQLDPRSLNNWLKNQPDGYIEGINSGYVNWLAISRLSKIISGINGIAGFDALEYKHFNGANTLQLTSDLNNGIPDILEEPGHFVVADGIDGNTVDINDPYFDNFTLEERYLNTFLSLGEFKKSSTDLSYIMFVVPEGVTLGVKDSSGNAITTESYTQQPLIDPINSEKGGEPLNIVLIPKPASANYKVVLSGLASQYYLLKSYLYDQNGNVQTFDWNGTVGLGSDDKYDLTFDNQVSSNSSQFKTVSFESAIADVNEFQDLSLIKGGGDLLSELRNAQKANNLGDLTLVQDKLNQLINHLNQHEGKTISEDAYKILMYDANYLQNNPN